MLKKTIWEKISLENWLYFTIFCLPIYLIRVSFLGLPSNLLEIFFLVGFFWWLLDKKYPQPNFAELWSKYKAYFCLGGLIFLGLLISTALSENYRAGLGIIKGWFVLPVLFFSLCLLIFDFKKTQRALVVFYFSALAVAVISWSYFILGRLTFDGRLEALFNSPNYLAMYLAPAVIIGSILFFKNKIFYGLSLSVIIGAIFLTKSFAAWIALALALFITSFFRKKENGKSFVIISVVCLIIVSFFLFQSGTKKLTDIFTLNQRSSTFSRFIVWEVAGENISQNFLWGIGPGNFQSSYLAAQESYLPYLEWAVPHPHNLWLSFWLYSGLLGLIGFLGLLILFFRNFFGKQKNALNLMALGIMLYVLIHGLVDTTYFKNDLAVIFWLTYLGMLKSKEKL